MKTILLFGILFLSIDAFAQAKATDYSGNWSLDKKQSRDLPSYYSNVSSHKLVVTQTAKQLTAATEIVFGENQPTKFQLVFNLDGTESITESVMGSGERIPTRLLAKILPDGKLRLSITRDMVLMNGGSSAVTTEEWELGKDGNLLTIRRPDENAGGRLASALVFVKNSK